MSPRRIVRILGGAVFLLSTMVPRVADLGMVLTVDEPRWQARGARFLEGLATGNFSQTFTHIHPGVTTAWLTGLARPWESLGASQAAVALAVSAGIIACTYVLIRLAGFWTGLAAGTALALDPFFIAHSRVVHTDALLAIFLLLAGLLLLLYRATRARRYLVAAGVASGLVALTKLHGLALLPLVPLALAGRGRTWSLVRRELRHFGLAAVLTAVVLWPALWFPTPTNLRSFWTLLSSEIRSTEGRGGEEHWWFYPREFLFRLTPGVTVFAPLGILVGLGALARRRPTPAGLEARDDRFASLVALPLAAAAAFLVVVLSLGPQKADRWILFAFLVVEVSAVAGALAAGSLLARVAGRTSWRHAVGGSLVALLLLASAGEVQRVHPYALAHFNRLLPVAENRKLGWGEGLEQVGAYLNARPDAGVPVASYYPDVLAHWYQGPVERLAHAADSPFRYVVLYRSMFERPLDSFEADFLDRYLARRTPLHTVTVNGLPYAWVFAGEGT